MIQVTERAANGLEKILTANRAPDDQGVKLVAAETGEVGMTIDQPGDGDVVLDGKNRHLLIVDAAIARQLDEAVIDLAADGEGEPPQFVIRREKASRPS